jgi:hypothetical protein
MLCAVSALSEHPERPPEAGALQVRALVYDDLRRSRLTVGFRLVLAIPHLLWLSIWGSVVFLIAPVQWIATLIRGRPIEGLHEMFGMFVRYTTHVYAYLALAGNRFPGFLGEKWYDVDVEVPPPRRQNRWTVGFRFVLATPAFLLMSTLLGGSATGNPYAVAFSAGVLSVIGLLGWFAALVRGRMPVGMRDLAVYAIAYGAQTWAYGLLLTDKYPDSDPLLVPLVRPESHPVRMRVDDDLRRSRLMVGFRAVLVTPHFVWLALWSIPILVTAIVGWLLTLIMGRLPTPLHRFHARYARYQAQVIAFFYLAGNPFPGFTGKPGAYPVEFEIAPPEPQSRWKTAFRGLLALPAFLLVATVSGASGTAAFLAWFAALFTGKMPKGLRNLIAYATRYQAQLYAYMLFLTDRYPNSGPGEAAEARPRAVGPAPAPEPALALTGEPA